MSRRLVLSCRRLVCLADGLLAFHWLWVLYKCLFVMVFACLSQAVDAAGPHHLRGGLFEKRPPLKNSQKNFRFSGTRLQ